MKCMTVTSSNANKTESSERTNEKGDGHTAVSATKVKVDYDLYSDPIDLATWNQTELLLFCNFQQGSRYKD